MLFLLSDQIQQNLYCCQAEEKIMCKHFILEKAKQSYSKQIKI